MNLRGKQKRYLRSQAHHMQPIVQIGKGGLTTPILKQIDDALEKREMFKICLLQNCDQDCQEVADEISMALDCDIVQIIGRVIVVFRPSTKEKNQQFSKTVRTVYKKRG